MHRRAYLSAAAAVILSGCVGSEYPGGADFDANGPEAGGEIDTTATPRPLPAPVRNDRLRPSPGPNEDTEAIEISVHEFVNGIRQEYDVPLFAWDEDMNESPRAHSRDMAHKGYFAKEAPNGQTFRPRGCEDWVEMLFRMRGRDTPPDTVAREAVWAWLSSDDHRTNLTDGHFLRNGLGAAKSSDGWIYLSHSLCR